MTHIQNFIELFPVVFDLCVVIAQNSALCISGGCGGSVGGVVEGVDNGVGSGQRPLTSRFTEVGSHFAPKHGIKTISTDNTFYYCCFFQTGRRSFLTASARVSTSCCGRDVVADRARRKETIEKLFPHVVGPVTAWLSPLGRFCSDPDDGVRC